MHSGARFNTEFSGTLTRSQRQACAAAEAAEGGATERGLGPEGEACAALLRQSFAGSGPGLCARLLACAQQGAPEGLLAGRRGRLHKSVPGLPGFRWARTSEAAPSVPTRVSRVSSGYGTGYAYAQNSSLG